MEEPKPYGRVLTGRKVIFSDAEAITAENVVEVLNKAMGVHIGLKF